MLQTSSRHPSLHNNPTVKSPIPSPRQRVKSPSLSAITAPPSLSAPPSLTTPPSISPPSSAIGSTRRPPPPSPSADLVPAPRMVAPSRLSRDMPGGVAEESEKQQPVSLGEFVLRYSTQLPLQMMVKKGYHGGDERHSIAAEDVYNVHFVKRTKVVALKDCRGAVFTIALNSAVQFSPLYNPNSNTREALQGMVFERVSDIMAQRTLPRIMRALKPHIRVDPMTTIEQFELFIVLAIVFSGVRRKMLKVYSATCNQHKLLPSDSVGGFTTDPRQTYLYPPEIVEHFLSEFPLDVKVVMNDGDLSSELPHHLTSEVSTLTHVDSETSLIASTNWGRNDQVTEEDEMPVDIPVDLPIEVVVQPSDSEGETHLSTHTKRLYERFDPSQIRLLRSRHVRRGFEKEGMELERPERIYDLPDVRLPWQSSQHNTDTEAATGKLRSVQVVSPRLRPRLDTPKSTPDSVSAYAQPYQLSRTVPSQRKTERTIPDSRQQLEHSPPKTLSKKPTGSHFAPAPLREKRPSASSEGSDSTRELELMGTRVDILEREVHALRSEIAKLKTQMSTGSSAGLSSVDDRRNSTERKNNIELLKTLSTKQVAELLQRMNLSQYQESFIRDDINGAILTQCTTEDLQMELGVASKIHRMRLLQLINGKTSAAFF